MGGGVWWALTGVWGGVWWALDGVWLGFWLGDSYKGNTFKPKARARGKKREPIPTWGEGFGELLMESG